MVRHVGPARLPGRSPWQRRLPGILFAVLLAVFGGTAAVPHQASATSGGTQAHAAQLARSMGQSGYEHSADAHHPQPPQQLHGAIAHSAYAATHAPLPLLPAVEQEAREPWHSSVLPERPHLSPAQLAHRSPRQGRAPPARTGA